jgi:adenylate cyclase
MAVEIERKFLVRGDEWRQAKPVRISQGYLNRDKDRTVRVRIAGNLAYLTVKGRTRGISRSEFEYAIPIADAEQLLPLCEGPLIEKYRHVLVYGTTKWEVDEFLGDNAGLVVAEVELEREDQPFDRPAWLLQEVTQDPKYHNSNLSLHPYNSWAQER